MLFPLPKVYENEGGLFFQDWTLLPTWKRMQAWDRQFKSLAALPNTVITPHAAFLTHEALQNIADATVDNLLAAALGQPLVNEVPLLAA